MLRFKEIVDLSVPIRSQGTPVFPGYPMPLKSTMTTLADTGWLSFLWSFVEHSGTHVDAPAHVVDGATPVDKVSLDRFVAEGAVIDLTAKAPKSKSLGSSKCDDCTFWRLRKIVSVRPG